jgi:hypothetical protein
MPKHKFLKLCFLITILSLGGCGFNLGGNDNSTKPNDSLVDSTGWVAFQGKGVLLAAPPNAWRMIPFDTVVALEERVVLIDQDPSVANVYQFLIESFVVDSKVLIVLMRNDGTAWLVIRRDSPDSVEIYIEELIQKQNAQGTNPIDRTTFQFKDMEATAWRIDYSPSGSQIVNSRWYVVFPYENSTYTLMFDAQSADFADYMPVFRTMLETLNFTQ